jgi:type VI secretion system secreted protein Hcp
MRNAISTLFRDEADIRQVIKLKAGAGAGTEVQYFTITLANASVSEINMQMPNTRHPDLMKFDTFEEVAFAYESIQWTWVDGGVTTSDSWAGRGD